MLINCTFSEWLLHGVIDEPSRAQSFSKRVLRASNALSPLNDSQRLSSVSQVSIGTLVPILLRTGRPSAIRRLVAFAVVDPVDRHSFRLAPHVSKKISIRLPSLAHSYTPASVIGVIGVGGACASGSHVRPNAPLRGFCAPRRVSVLRVTGNKLVMKKTSARSGSAGAEFTPSYNRSVSAFASAIPTMQAADFSSVTNDRQSSVHFSYDIDRSSHKNTRTTLAKSARLTVGCMNLTMKSIEA